jgi:glucose dehydrogenase
LNIVIYIVAAAIGLLLSCVGIVFALLGGGQFAYVIGGLLVVAHIASFLYVRRKAIQGQGHPTAIVLVLPMPLVMGLLYIFEVGKYAISVLGSSWK